MPNEFDRLAAEEPDRFTREAEHNRPPNVYKPFGDGQRACIGRQFALQEATLVLGMLLQRFELVDFRNYQLHIREALTIKPENSFIRVRPRTHRNGAVAPAEVPERVTQPAAVAEAEPEPEPGPVAVVVAHATPLLVDHHGQKDILVPGQNRLTAFDAKTHGELWQYGQGEGPFNGEIISSPVHGAGMVFLAMSRYGAVASRATGSKSVSRS